MQWNSEKALGMLMQWSPNARLYFTPFKSTDPMMPSSLWRVFISNALLFRTASADSLVCRRQSVEMSRHNTCLWHKWVMLLCRTCTYPSDDMNMREICETLRDPVCQHDTLTDTCEITAETLQDEYHEPKIHFASFYYRDKHARFTITYVLLYHTALPSG